MKHKINVLQSLLDEFATVGILSCPYEKLHAVQNAIEIAKDYVYDGSTKKTLIADRFMSIADHYFKIVVLDGRNLNTKIMQAVEALENALSALVDS